ncbi:MAG: radical SAM protein [Clostridia bacterium]|nr:radical SAM protein [Clostridia bacterium]
MAAVVHSFESLAAVDGAGVRCAVFLCGCPLRCVYCHNPDTWQPTAGRETDAPTLVAKIARYKPYFGVKGGVTFSGGEPLLQAGFIAETVPLLQREGIGYIIDTSGHVPLDDTVKYVLAHAQAVLLDLKFPDDEMYRTYTGAGIGPTLAMLDYLAEIGRDTCVRTVIVPGINDSEAMLDRYLAHLTGRACVSRYELLAFHTMGFHKYEQLGMANPLADVPPLDAARKVQLQAYADRQLRLA